MSEHKQMHILNQRQMSWMMATVLISGGLVSLPKILLEIGKQDSWFSQALGVGYAIFMAYFYALCAKKFPGKHLFDIVFLLCGRWFGGFLNALHLFYLWMVLIRDTRSFADFMNSTLLLKTPEEITFLLFILVLMYYSKSSVEVIARVNDLMFPLFVVVLFVLPLLLTNEFSFERLEPVLGSGFAQVIESNILPLGWFGDMIVAGAFLHTLSVSRQIRSALTFAVSLSGVGLSLLLFMCICVLGSTVAGRMMYPNFTLVEQIHITDYLDRLELVMFSVWLPSFLLKVSFLYTAFIIGLNSFTKRTKQNLYSRQLGWFLVVTTAMAFHSVVEVFDFGNFGSLFTLGFIQFPFTMFLFVLLLRSKHDEGERKTDEEIRQKERERRDDPNTKWIDRMTGRTWFVITLSCLGCSFVFIIVGAALGRDNAWIGATCGILYSVSMLMMMVASYLEMRQVRLTSLKPELKQKQEQKLA
ncbi:GerAB/ArcD/ProY family transporter [Tumebacillus flagellatus]|uniref:Uncharacterized protein n=1 Tax=Tumebacillus flagellatus TaxID=1157490 RepID=A0A074LRN3_9BACL|nr:endospore germination permease [Tumebacillus flagellatus]KEO84801.1 hypothetical protein EL26_01970 [Tumebacillus flagellatus]